jgi:EmrB/QacA subfamily drug resistance transporter
VLGRRPDLAADDFERTDDMHRIDGGNRTTDARKWWTLAAVCTGVFMLLLDITIVNVALPDIERAFGASLSDLQWVISAYALTLAAFLLTAGSLADLYGRRLLFASGIVFFTAGSLLCGLATGSLFLELARGAQGIGGAIMFATSLALLAQAFQGRDRGIALGLFGAITGIAVAIGPVLGGAITSGLSWRWIFYVNIPIGVLALAITLLRVEESRNPDANRPDWAGFVTFSAALACLVYGLIESQHDGWSSTTVIGSLAASAVLLAVFVVVERVRTEPMLDLGLLRVPTFGGGLAAAWAISAALFSIITYLTIYLQNSLGLSAIATGVRFLPLTGAIFVAAGVAGRLTSHVPRRLLIAPGFLLIGTGVLLMRGLTPSSGWTHLLAGMIVSGIGGGLVSTPLVSTAVGVVRPARAGMASGINSTLRQVGIATGVAALGTILASHVSSSVADRLSGTPLAGHAHALAHKISTGGTAQAIAHTPAPLRGLVAITARSALVEGLNTILLISAIVAFAAAALSFVLIRERDFVSAEESDEPEEQAELAVAA